ncbi:MAG: DNA methyltransferase [Candidatus Paceibacterota bacterium]
MSNIKIEYVDINLLHASEYNPRTWDEFQKKQLKESINRFGTIDPLIVNKNKERTNVVIGGHFRLEVCKELGHTTIPVVFLDLTEEKEKELNLRLNKNQGEFNYDLLAEFDETILADIGFDSEELDIIFDEDHEEELFDLQKELEKLDIKEVTVKKGDIYDLDGSRLMCGDSTTEADVTKLFGKEKAQMVMTDPPYILDYLHGKTKHGEATTGFGAKKNRRYLETESIPEDFTEKWMANVNKIQDEHFAIIVYENWKNIRTIWNEMEKYWKVRNMLIWHLPNRNQGYAGKHKLFSKYDIAMVGTDNKEVNLEQEGELVENEYETALFAISGKPHWESYGKNKKYCPTDFIEHNAADEKSSGQGIIFGTKPVEILIPYIKILTKRDELVYEPFGGSGSTLIAANRLNRRCFLMEKSNVYTEVILNRWEKYTGKKRVKING